MKKRERENGNKASKHVMIKMRKKKRNSKKNRKQEMKEEGKSLKKKKRTCEWRGSRKWCKQAC